MGPAGTVTLQNNNNSYSGGLAIQSGTLNTATVNNISTNGPLGNNTSVMLGSSTVSAIGTLEYTGSSASSSMPFTLVSNSIAVSGGAFQIDSAATNLTLTGLISGGASGQPTSLTKTGPQHLTLNNSNNSYFGATNISQGTLVTDSIANTNANSSMGSGGSIKLLNSGTTFQYTGGTTSTNRAISMASASATLDASGSGPISFTNILPSPQACWSPPPASTPRSPSPAATPA